MMPAEPCEGEAARPPRIIRISVQKLFGSLDHDIELRRTDRVTLIHGINGVGKTKLLELTAALTQGRLDRLMEVPFEELRVGFDDGMTVVVAQDSQRQQPLFKEGPRLRSRRSGKIARRVGLEIRRIRTATGETIADLPSSAIAESLELAARKFGLPPWLEPLASGDWLDTRTNRVMSLAELRERYRIALPAFQPFAMPNDEFRKIVPCTPAHLIETQRLLRKGTRRLPEVEEDSGSLVMTVHEIAGELKQHIAAVQNVFFRKTQELDRTRIERVLSATKNADSEGPGLRTRLEALHTHRERLERVGLLEAGALGRTFSPSEAASLHGDRALMIAVHTDDAEQQFKILDPLATRLELLLTGMNEKLAYPKKLVLTPERELTVQRHAETISLEQLSSGEQHELVLLYDLAFRIQPNTLVLIDEPELSLHPTWQEQFLEDILKLAKTGEFDVMIATHSPYIIGNRNDLCVELKEEQRA